MHGGLGESDAVVLDAYDRTIGVQADAQGVGGGGRFEAMPGGEASTALCIISRR
ncbi:hypothetical protein GCM10014715_10990 [Streptomyces spiralis]|uniref:Uncharacterized protein n=1 Tax=Streptomyces spiralis TaxID=66376 RepID=A0A919DMA2_9ACTN|nr:hypothetical protein GCM10014715_10990 [Streptomyces spiralis]